MRISWGKLGERLRFSQENLMNTQAVRRKAKKGDHPLYVFFVLS